VTQLIHFIRRLAAVLSDLVKESADIQTNKETNT